MSNARCPEIPFFQCKMSLLGTFARRKEFYNNDGMVNIIMNTNRIVSIEDIEEFLKGTRRIKFKINSKKDKYELISDNLIKVHYRQLGKKKQKIVRKYLSILTAYSPRHIRRLIKLWKSGKLLSSLTINNRTKFPCKYGPIEIALLAQADQGLNYPNGYALKESLIREYEVFKKEKYKTISQISVSHIYNIRKNSSQYKSLTMHYTKTNPVNTPIGERRKPNPDGKPGYLRVDSVHQGDFKGVKGVYHINIVDEVTQWEIVGCVEQITEEFMGPLLKELMEQFPFRILNFHSDNGSEYINHSVAGILNSLIIKQTKSRSRRTNDQALVESKNGSVIRKHIGRNYIPKKYAPKINDFYREYFNLFLNYHRVCGFSTDYVDKRGKIRKKYDEYLTPYEKLKSLKNAKQYLREGVSFAELDKIAYAESDIEFGNRMNEAKKKLFKSITL